MTTSTSPGVGYSEKTGSGPPVGMGSGYTSR